jgi:cardiolipin synthase
MASAPISEGSSRILTVPNFLTLLRALGIPFFLWLFLVQQDATWSFVVLALGALTDYFDGKVARALNQVSSLGAAMDPSIDRIYIASTVIALAIRNFIPWWMVIILALRDLWMVAALIVKRKRTGKVFEVTYLGKAATFNLLYAFPVLLLSGKGVFGEIMHVIGWSFALWGIGLYLLTAVQYSSDAFKKGL